MVSVKSPVRGTKCTHISDVRWAYRELPTQKRRKHGSKWRGLSVHEAPVRFRLELTPIPDKLCQSPQRAGHAEDNGVVLIRGMGVGGDVRLTLKGLIPRNCDGFGRTLNSVSP